MKHIQYKLFFYEMSLNVAIYVIMTYITNTLHDDDAHLNNMNTVFCL